MGPGERWRVYDVSRDGSRPDPTDPLRVYLDAQGVDSGLVRRIVTESEAQWRVVLLRLDQDGRAFADPETGYTTIAERSVLIPAWRP